jgi:hypothetical protein
MTRTFRAVAVSLAASLCACNHAPARIPPPPSSGAASWRQVLPEGTSRYELAIGQVSSGAVPEHRTTPVYPPALLQRCPPPAEVRALLIVDVAGKVDDVRVDGEASADADRRLYIAAVKTAARQWAFVPLKVDRWAADANGESHVVDSETRPFSLAYDFRFECHAGAARVTSGDAPSAAGHGSE